MADVAPEVDTAALRRYLAAELGEDVTVSAVLHDGLNLSLALSTSEADPAYVLRRPNKLRHTESFNDVHREYGVLERLQGTPIDAPASVLVCEDESVIGDPFLVMAYLEGDAVPLGSRLPERFRHPAARERLAYDLVDTLADLHTLDPEPFADVCERRPIEDQVAEAIGRYERATEVTGHEAPGLWDVAEWLEASVPQDADLALAHGDFRPANVLFDGEEIPEIVGVLDWETAFLGDPLTELGYLLLRWRDDGDPTPSIAAIEERYPDHSGLDRLRERNEHGLAPFTGEPGSPTRRDLVARYEERTGTAFEHERFYRAFAAFVLAAVWADLHRYAIEAGEETDWVPDIDYMAAVATSIVDGTFEL